MNKLRTALRERTRSAHQRLDSLFSGLDLRKRDHYARFLAAQAGAFEAIEKRLDEVGAQAVIPDWPQRKRWDAIRVDLEKLEQRHASAAPQVANWIEDRASILGTAYVLEGSRLGGAVLLREIRTSPDPAVAETTDFLSHGESQRFWVSFDAILGSSDLTDSEVDKMVTSAVRTFELFETSAQQAL